jgi:hypothetical protein
MIRVLGLSLPRESTLDICTNADLSPTIPRRRSRVGKHGHAHGARGRARTWRRLTLRATAVDA